MVIKKFKDFNWLTLVLVIGCFMTNISQLPYFVDRGITQYMNVPIWIAITACLFFTSKVFHVNKTTLHILLIYFSIFLCMLIFQLFDFDKVYLTSSMFISLTMSVAMFAIGSIASNKIDIDDLKYILISYIISTFIVSLQIFSQYFSDGLWFASVAYLFDSKNSFAQIALSSMMILFFIDVKNKKLAKTIKVVLMSFFLFFIVILRSRAVILSLVVCLLLFFMMQTKYKNIKKYIVGILTFFMGLLFISETFRNYLVNNIMLSGANLSNLDAVSSGRLSIISTFPELIDSGWITGIGNIYFECFPLSAILNFGILVGFLVIMLSYSPLVFAYSSRQQSLYNEMFLYITIGYIVNSLFEGLAPIGPGAKCYFLWLFFGLLQSKLLKRETNE